MKYPNFSLHFSDDGVTFLQYATHFRFAYANRSVLSYGTAWKFNGTTRSVSLNDDALHCVPIKYLSQYYNF